MRSMITILFAIFCMGLHADEADSINIFVTKLFLNNPTNEEVIRAYNQIVTGRTFEQSEDQNIFESVRRSLHDEEIAIEAFEMTKDDGTKEYVLFAVRNYYDAPKFMELFNEDVLHDEIVKGEKAFKDTIVATMLLSPLLDELKTVKTIYFTPAGKFHSFPIEYCNIEDGVMLADKYEFYRLTSSAILTQRKEAQEVYQKYAIYGGIDFDALPVFEEKYDESLPKYKFGFLRDSYLAGVDIHHMLTEKGLKSFLYDNDHATEKSLKDIFRQNIQVFLIETHGVSVPGNTKTDGPDALMLSGASYVMEGGIVPEGYEDGLVTTSEISILNLSSIDLAVISACKSALGRVSWKGVDGLPRAFKTAGVKSLVMTTDDVVDYVSGMIWRLFFRNLIDGMGKRVALLNAIKEARTTLDGFYASPKYWTPFVLIDGIDF